MNSNKKKMEISELIKQLCEIRNQYGNVEVCVVDGEDHYPNSTIDVRMEDNNYSENDRNYIFGNNYKDKKFVVLY